MESVREILEDLGFNLKQDGKFFRSSAIYREGDNPNILRIDSQTGKWYDFKECVGGKLEDLIALTLKKDLKEVKEWLDNKQFSIKKEIYRPKLKLPKTMEKLELDKLIPDYNYWINRGISEQTCKTFVGGKCLTGSQKDRQVLAVFNSKKDLIGLVGRALTNEKLPKYKINGPKTEFVWPAYLNSRIIMEQKSVILVESPACILKLWDCGVKNTLCLFGVEISFAIINFLIKVAPKKIYIATNNEDSKVGNEAAEKILRKLNRYFDGGVAEIKLPPRKDFADCSQEELENYKKNLDE
jgi:hypothetical protein